MKNLNMFVLYVFAFSLPFYRFLSTYALGIWILVFILQLFHFKKPNLKPLLSFIIIMWLFFLLHFIGITYSANTKEAWTDIILKIPFLIMPFLFLFSIDDIKKNLHRILLSFVAGNFVASLICIVAACIRSLSFTNGTWVFDAELMNHNYSFWEMLANGGNNFMYEPLSIFIHTGYFSLYLVFSVLIIIDFLKKGVIGKTRNTKILWGCLIVFFSIMIYLIFSRAGQIAYFTMLFSYMLYLIFHGGKKILKTAILFVITFLGIIIMSHNERMQNSYRDIKNLFSGEITNNNDRLVIWSVSLDIIKNNFISGVGTGDTKDVLFENYRQNHMEEAVKEKLNVHNQYLETSIQFGIIGFSLLFSLFIFMLWKAIKKQHIILLLFMVINGIFFFFETALNRQAGIFFFVFFLSLFMMSILAPKKEI